MLEGGQTRTGTPNSQLKRGKGREEKEKSDRRAARTGSAAWISSQPPSAATNDLF